MCGITGIINFTGQDVSHKSLKLAADSISHRGPDDSGEFIERNVGIAHRRLSIIDVTSAGNQPMESKDGRYIIAYNFIR